MNKITLLGAAFLTTVSLVGCGGEEEGLGNRNFDTGIEPVRYNENTDIAPNRDRIEMNEREFGPDYGRLNNGNNGNRDGNFGYNTNYDNDVNEIRRNNFEEYDVADRAAERIARELEEVDRAYVFVGPENAYVAVVLKGEQNGRELTDDVKSKIEQITKTVETDIDDVFVSANPDFANQAGDYADELEAGDPVEGLFDEMGDMFRRIFPDNQ
jgi:spore cortex protein